MFRIVFELQPGLSPTQDPFFFYQTSKAALYRSVKKKKQKISEVFLGKREFLTFNILKVPVENCSSFIEMEVDPKEVYSSATSGDCLKALLHFYKYNSSKNELLKKNKLPPESLRSKLVCIANVPASVDCCELLHFLRSSLAAVSNIRIVQEQSKEIYLVLLQFRTQLSADDFFLAFNDVPYNLNSTLCHVLFVEKVEIVEGSCFDYYPPLGTTELPSCSVCLEFLDDQTTAIFTTLCNHSFHCQCIRAWKPRSCPVCRFSQSPQNRNECSSCGVHEGLWMCLVCGNIGCGRYLQRHSFEHFTLTQHTYAMDLQTQRVWDYAADNYVHRLVQSSEEGKLVEVSSAFASVEEKVDSLTLEYSHLLSAQMEEQKRYFTEQLELRSQDLTNKIELLESKLNEEKKKNNTLLSQLTNTQLSYKKCTSELQEERQLSKSLEVNLQYWKKQKEAKEKLIAQNEQEIAELKSQVRDLMFFLETREKLKEDPELQDGKLIVVDKKTLPSKKKQKAGSWNKKTKEK
jgi:BRCA1-associated protein